MTHLSIVVYLSNRVEQRNSKKLLKSIAEKREKNKTAQFFSKQINIKNNTIGRRVVQKNKKATEIIKMAEKLKNTMQIKEKNLNYRRKQLGWRNSLKAA